MDEYIHLRQKAHDVVEMRYRSPSTQTRIDGNCVQERRRGGTSWTGSRRLWEFAGVANAWRKHEMEKTLLPSREPFG